MSDIDLSKYVKDLQALFINIAWKTGYKKSGKTFSDFDNLTLEKASIMRNGILFIWVDKEIMGDLITYMDRMKFHYIENSHQHRCLFEEPPLGEVRGQEK